MTGLIEFAPPLTADRALAAVEQAVAACPADEVEVTLLGRSGEYSRFAGERIHQPQDITEVSVSVKAIVNGHAARAATSSLDRVAETARRAGELAGGRTRLNAAAGSARVAAGQGENAAEPVPELSHEDTLAFDAGRRVALIARAMHAAAEHGGRAAGMIGRAYTQIAVGTSTGVRRHAVATEASGSLTMAIDDGTAHWVDLHRSADALDAAGSIDRALQRALAGRGRIEMPDGEFTVVLGPQAAGELIGFLDALGFSGELAAAGVGVWARQAGRRLVSELVTVADDATSSYGLPIPFDFEGVSKRRVPFFAAGVVGEPVTDLATAAVLGRESSGNAHIAREEVPSPVAANLVLQPGTDTEESLIAGVERGVYVERFWYTRLVDRQASTITGVSRDGCFLIRDGRLAEPVATGRFTQSVLDFLASVDGVADRVRSQPVMNVWNGSASAPAVRGHRFRFGSRPVGGAR
ncbi:MAG TPA: TldD/PmbA family protein [Jatrophihabitans sp.]|nr:TldD/PmbA family protein [Jatrophihabitans sp.]